MSAKCCASPVATTDPVYRRVLWIALALNAAMFFVEIGAGAFADSTALLADAVDFFGDAANYGISLAVLALAPAWRSRAALIKGCSMGLFGIFVIAKVFWSAATGSSPQPFAMGAVALLALIVNVGVAVMLYRYRCGDANMRSVWLCSRNDAIGNIAVMFAALGVFGTGSAWPDLGVAAMLGLLALLSARSIISEALRELRDGHRIAAGDPLHHTGDRHG
ncbi:MAG: cation transporter [Burkholderiales bacterium]|nr:cation transporter [Burkholderiales bacterium]